MEIQSLRSRGEEEEEEEEERGEEDEHRIAKKREMLMDKKWEAAMLLRASNVERQTGHSFSYLNKQSRRRRSSCLPNSWLFKSTLLLKNKIDA